MCKNTKMEQVLWVAHTLFDQGMVTGCTGNISFKQEDKIYISKSGSCFGNLTNEDFAILDIHGEILEGKPSKEYPLHLYLYRLNECNQAVLHTHSFYSTLLTCQARQKEELFKDLLITTPYLSIKTKNHMGWVPYFAPGSQELFESFMTQMNEKTNLYLMERHGLIASGSSVMNVFDLISEMETSAHLHYCLNQ